MTTITRRIEFDYGHRVLGHEGKCKHLHGHRGVAEITVSGDLDPLGRVIDFSVLKSVVGKWVDDNWDHNMLLHPKDPLCGLGQSGQVSPLWMEQIFNGKEPYVFPPETNPTAENIARVLGEKAIELLKPYHIEVVGVRVFETPNCWADWNPVEMIPEYEG